uniref:Centrosomal protein 95 n=1 Tax=Myripristis murdjan TaxID=586833 RepID=A0A668A1F3_9TELE
CAGNWVDVANDLLSKCHINLRLRKVTDCDANVFIALYESILGEKVPDYIAAPCCQEDDVHNVQSVIDSLALDYLQISLSHITGENIVRGDKESIKNLLEIFDGLLEYLNEEISEESHNGGKHELIQVFSLLIQICASQLIYSFIYVCIFTPKINILPNN